MAEDFTLEQISADGINNNFSTLKNVIETKANLNGDSTQRFNVADAVELTEAINKGQLDNSVTTINSKITNIETEFNTQLATKLDISDPTVTKQGNIFNGANQLVQLDSNGKLPAVDGSQLTGIRTSATLDTSNMPNMANNTTNPNTQIDFSAGFCFDNTLTKQIISAAMTKKLDAPFAEGNGNGGLDTGAKTINTWYHCFAISKADGTSDFLFSTSLISPTMPSGYVYKRRIGSIMTEISGNIKQFKQYGDDFMYASTEAYRATSGIPIIPTDLVLPTPLGIKTRPYLEVILQTSINAIILLIDKNTSNLISPVYSINSCYGISQVNSIYTDTESKIQHYGTSSVAMTYAIQVNGYTDTRGKN